MTTSTPKKPRAAKRRRAKKTNNEPVIIELPEGTNLKKVVRTESYPVVLPNPATENIIPLELYRKDIQLRWSIHLKEWYLLGKDLNLLFNYVKNLPNVLREEYSRGIFK